MSKYGSNLKTRTLVLTAILATLVTGCGQDAIFGSDGSGSSANSGPGPAGSAPALGSAATFGTFGGSAGMTNQGILTQINNGDIGTTATATGSITGFHDSPPSDIYTETLAHIGAVSGEIFTCAVSPTGPTSAAVNPVSCALATQARLDAQAAYLALVAKPAGPFAGAGNLSGLTLAPGTYTSATGFLIQDGLPGPAGDLTLDAQGNANAVWVFQMGSTLVVGGPGAAFPRSVNLVNGAQAKNVFWQVGSAATINAGGGGTMVGTIISQSGVSLSTAASVILVTLNGRAQSLVASVTMNNTIINVPAP